jgi:hypothetical protein
MAVASTSASADALLRKRIGAREHNLPVSVRADQLTFHEAAQAVIDDFVANKKKSVAVVQRRIDLHLKPFFGGRRDAARKLHGVAHQRLAIAD